MMAQPVTEELTVYRKRINRSFSYFKRQVQRRFVLCAPVNLDQRTDSPSDPAYEMIRIEARGAFLYLPAVSRVPVSQNERLSIVESIQKPCCFHTPT